MDVGHVEVGVSGGDGTSLETVRILHQTVVTLRVALEKSRTELHSLREQVKKTVDTTPFTRTIENLSIENHILRQKVLSTSASDENLAVKEEKMSSGGESKPDGDLDSSVEENDVFEDEVKPLPVDGVVENCEKQREEPKHQMSLLVPARMSKGDSEESEEVDDIELIFTTGDTKELSGLQEDLVSIAETDHWKPHDQRSDETNLKNAWSQSVLVETDISKCGVIDENEPPPSDRRRNTLPTPSPYKPIIHKENSLGSRHQLNDNKHGVKFSNIESNHHSVRPILVEKNSVKQESEAQTDITALPVQWRSESYLAHHKVAHNFTTLPSKFTLPFGQTRKQSLRLCEKTQEARRVLLSDINFTSMVPELSRSADHLCQEANLLCKYPRAFSYMKNPDCLTSPGYLKGPWSPCDCSHRRPSWDYYQGSSFSIPPSALDLTDMRRRHSMRPSISSLDTYWTSLPQRPTWASMPSSPTHCRRSRSVPLSSSYIKSQPSEVNICCSTGCRYQGPRHERPPFQRTVRINSVPSKQRVKFEDTKLSRSFPGMSLPDLRIKPEMESREESTDSLIDESEDFLRRSIDSILTGGEVNGRYKKGCRWPTVADNSYGMKPPRRAQPFLARVPSDLKVDYWVKVIIGDGKVAVGRVKYVGPLMGESEPYVGVHLLPGEGNTDGTFDGTRFFECGPNSGIFVPFKKVVMAWSF